MKTTKILFILLLPMLFAQGVKGQEYEFAPVGATWYYDYTNSWITFGYSKYESEKDTIVQGNECKKISVFREWINYGSPPIHSTYADPIIIFEENNVIYIYYENDFDTLFNYNAAPGDFWKLSGQTCVEKRYVTVIDTGSALIGGCVKKWITIAYQGFSMVSDTVYQNYGSIKWGFELFDFCSDDIMDKPVTGNLRCYTDSICLFINTDFDCDYILNVSHFQLQDAISVFPNPTNESFMINSKNDNIKLFSVSVYDLYGRKVYETINISNNERIDVSFLSKGVYIVIIKFDNSEIIKKLIISDRLKI